MGPYYERAVSDLDRSKHRSLWVRVAHSSFIEGSLTTKNKASDYNVPKFSTGIIGSDISIKRLKRKT